MMRSKIFQALLAAALGAAAGGAYDVWANARDQEARACRVGAPDEGAGLAAADHGCLPHAKAALAPPPADQSRKPS